MWVLASGSEGRYRHIAINLETGAQLRIMLQLPNPTAAIKYAFKSSDGDNFEGNSVTVGQYDSEDEASAVFKKLLVRLHTIDVSNPSLDLIEG